MYIFYHNFMLFGSVERSCVEKECAESICAGCSGTVGLYAIQYNRVATLAGE